MKSTLKLVSTTSAVASLLLISTASHATVGYFSLGYGTGAKGMAGAGVALPLDGMIGAINPAGMVQVGNCLDVGAAYFDPERQYTVSGAPSGLPGTFGLAPGTVHSKVHAFGIPHFAYNRMLGPRSSVGIVVFGNGGMNTSYSATAGGVGTYGAGATGVNLCQLFLAPTYARQVSPKMALGASITFAYQEFSASGLANFSAFVSDGSPDNLTNRGNDNSYGVGGRIGALYSASPNLTLGVAYQTRTWMSKFSKYSDLFADHGAFDIPPAATAGIAVKTSPSGIFVFDTQYIWYSEVHSIGNPYSNLKTGLTNNDPSMLLGGPNGPGFGWKNMTIYKLGYQQQAGPEWTVRAAVAYGREPIRSTEVLCNILAPGVQEWHYTLGATKKVSRNSEIAFAAMYSPTSTVSGPNPMEAPGQQQIELSMHQYELEADYGIRW